MLWAYKFPCWLFTFIYGVYLVPLRLKLQYRISLNKHETYFIWDVALIVLQLCRPQKTVSCSEISWTVFGEMLCLVHGPFSGKLSWLILLSCLNSFLTRATLQVNDIVCAKNRWRNSISCVAFMGGKELSIFWVETLHQDDNIALFCRLVRFDSLGHNLLTAIVNPSNQQVIYWFLNDFSFRSNDDLLTCHFLLWERERSS